MSERVSDERQDVRERYAQMFGDEESEEE